MNMKCNIIGNNYEMKYICNIFVRKMECDKNAIML